MLGLLNMTYCIIPTKQDITYGELALLWPTVADTLLSVSQLLGADISDKYHFVSPKLVRIPV